MWCARASFLVMALGCAITARPASASGELAAQGKVVDGVRTGRWVLRWESGERKAVGKFVDGLREGVWLLFSEDGSRLARGPYVGGVREGEWTYWRPDKEVDPSLSGVYHTTVLASDADAGWEGETLDGERHGRWTYYRPNRRTMMVGDYVRGVMQGPWLFLHADGTVEPEWFTGRYERGVRVGPAREPPEGVPVPPAFRDLARMPALDAEPTAADAVEAFLTGNEGARRAARERLLAAPREAFPAILDRLVGLDLAARPDEALARRLEEHLLAVICGGGRPWVRGTDDAAVATNTLSILRWFSFWELMADREELWALNFDPAWRWTELEPRFTVLADPPPPGLFAGSRLAPATAVADASGPLALAVDWIADQQSEPGAWRPEANGGDARLETAVTAVCILALQRAGSTATAGPHRAPVERGLRWLVQHQVPLTGAVSRSPLDTDYQNALAAEALVQGAATSGIPVVRQSAHRAVAYLTAVQLTDGSWSDRVGDARGHPVVTAAALRALHLARATGIAVDEEKLVSGLAWLHGRTDVASGESAGRLGEALTSRTAAVASAGTLLVRLLAGQAPELPIVQIQAGWLVAHPPSVFPDQDESDPLYAYLGTSAMRRVDGDAWSTWSEPVQSLLVGLQTTAGDSAGSWDVRGTHGEAGGRLWSTALAALTLAELLPPE